MQSVKEYIAQFSGGTRERLETLDTLITSIDSRITSKIAWSMPSYLLDGVYVLQFFAHKNHIGLYALPKAIQAFEKQLKYNGIQYSKGGFQLPNDKPLPVMLIKEMALFNINAKTKMRAGLVINNKPRAAATPRQEKQLPTDLETSLIQARQLENYKARPRYQRTDYITWIERAARTETREKRITQMIEELQGGDSYMGMSYKANKKGE